MSCVNTTVGVAETMTSKGNETWKNTRLATHALALSEVRITTWPSSPPSSAPSSPPSSTPSSLPHTLPLALPSSLRHFPPSSTPSSLPHSLLLALPSSLGHSPPSSRRSSLCSSRCSGRPKVSACSLGSLSTRREAVLGADDLEPPVGASEALLWAWSLYYDAQTDEAAVKSSLRYGGGYAAGARPHSVLFSVHHLLSPPCHPCHRTFAFPSIETLLLSVPTSDVDHTIAPLRTDSATASPNISALPHSLHVTRESRSHLASSHPLRHTSYTFILSPRYRFGRYAARPLDSTPVFRFSSTSWEFLCSIHRHRDCELLSYSHANV